jgi:hypothetical protein
MRIITASFLLVFSNVSAFAQDTGDVFADTANGAKQHVASGFVCPPMISRFERDAVGERDPGAGSDFCAYSALEGVYGTVTLIPLKGPYDPKTALVPDFIEQEGIGGKMIGEATLKIGAGGGPFQVYTRSYNTSALADIQYRVLFAGSAVGNWAVQVTVEYASPRDDALARDFLNLVYAGALSEIAAVKPAP